MKEGGTWEGKRSGGREKVNKKRRNGERYFPGALFFAERSPTRLLN